MIFWVIISAFVVSDLAWWVWADLRLRRFQKPTRWRAMLAIYMATLLGGFAALFLVRGLDLEIPIPLPLLAAIYLWHLVILPITVGLTLTGETLAAVSRFARWLLRRNSQMPVPTEAPPAEQPLTTPSRRQLLTAAAVAVPPLLTIGAVGTALPRLGRFRTRSFTLHLPDLPAALDGLTIAHVSDTHVGKFTRAAQLDAIVEQTNALNADLVLMTGDLIDFDLDDLPAALEMVRAFRSRHGFYMCEGNHDLIEDRAEFEAGVLDAGVPLLLNHSHTLSIRGHDVQILGIPWGRPGAGRRDAGAEAHVATVARQIRRGAFPILLAHHPHAFDAARKAAIPLTLAGHTHGGQLMLNQEIGPGPLMFKYWSGLYQKAKHHLVVSNGVGNWFPLRTNAPAELVHLTLRSTTA